MFLVIGGSHQGKMAWAQQQFNLPADKIADGELLDISAGKMPDLSAYQALYGLHNLLRRVVEADWTDEQAEALQAELLRLPTDFVLICDEIGAGLVPVEHFGRAYRELVGRTCCLLAKEAEGVWRIFCGLPQRIK